MNLESLKIGGVRNIEAAELADLQKINHFYGANGSGKTSVLEAIYFLNVARSFRTHRSTPMLNHEMQACVVRAGLSAGHSIGISRSRNASVAIKIDGNDCHKVSELSRFLPVQLIDATAFSLLEGGPGTRRKFLDWGLFHVEHRFYPLWQQVQKLLKQRNAQLRGGRMDDALIDAWDTQLAEHGSQLDAIRVNGFDQLEKQFVKTIAELPEPMSQIRAEFFPGWDKQVGTFSTVLQMNRERDLKRGQTSAGPHRCDVLLKIDELAANDVLSRGQKKVIAAALKVSQLALLKAKGINAICLVDDIASELDKTHCQWLFESLVELDIQIFITSIEADELPHIAEYKNKTAMFHVEHGAVIRV